MSGDRGFGLRAGFALLLLGLMVSAVAANLPEFSQLARALSRTYHFGAPPSPLAVGGTVLVLVGGGVLLDRILRAARAPLWPLALVLVGVALPTFALLTQDDGPQGRSWAAADAVLLEGGNLLRRQMVETLRKEGTVPSDPEAWQRALGELTAQTPSPVRDCSFARVPLRVIRLQERPGDTSSASADGLIPGSYGVWISPERDAFEVHPIGFDPRGNPARLADDQGRPVVLRGGARQEGWQSDLPRRQAGQDTSR